MHFETENGTLIKIVFFFTWIRIDIINNIVLLFEVTDSMVDEYFKPLPSNLELNLWKMKLI